MAAPTITDERGEDQVAVRGVRRLERASVAGMSRAPDGAGRRADRRYLVTTDHGDVVVSVNPAAGGLDADLLTLEAATPTTTAGIELATPLRAFGAKMLDIIEIQGIVDVGVSPSLRDMLMREKATQDLKRIERFAKTAAAPY